MVYLDPQEKIWPQQLGHCFTLSELQHFGALCTPFDGIEGFNLRKMVSYPHTLFRLPLRTEPSDLSENIYSIESLIKLMDALRDEAKVLLLFLRSVHTIEVHTIFNSNTASLQFSVQIAPCDRARLIAKRISFMTKLKNEYQVKKYKIHERITSRFSVEIKDMIKTTTETTSWLIVNQVGSQDAKIHMAAAKQHALPWIGTAMQLNADNKPQPGRIFCFLPLPADATSGLPVHVNGTFGLNDDRRTIKWPGGERRNDPTAAWNQMLIKELLPSCYNHLLKTAVEDCHVSPDLVYHAWPVIETVSHTNWAVVLQPLFEAMSQWECLWVEKGGKWIKMSQATLTCTTVPDEEQPANVVKRALTTCGLLLAEVPGHILVAVEHIIPHVKKVTPSLVRSELRSCPLAYQREARAEKLNLLQFCLHDEEFYSEMHGFELLPVTSHIFKSFQ